MKCNVEGILGKELLQREDPMAQTAIRLQGYIEVDDALVDDKYQSISKKLVAARQELYTLKVEMKAQLEAHEDARRLMREHLEKMKNKAETVSEE